MDPHIIENRCLEYCYTKLCRQTFFGQWPPHTRAEMTCIPLHKTWTPQNQSRDDMHTTTQNLADEPTLANGPPSNRAEMTCIPLHKTWQMNLLWPMDPPYQSRDVLHTTTQNLAVEPTLANGPPIPEQRWLAYHYTKCGRWTYFGQWTPQYQSRDDLHTTTLNLADEPTLAEHNGKGLKALAFTISEIPHSIFSKHIFA